MTLTKLTQNLRRSSVGDLEALDVFAMPGDWAWDFWLADDGQTFHLFFLTAPKTPADPELRHLTARIGHAVSTDLKTWQRLPDALAPGEVDVDDTATWTGSVVRHPNGDWLMFYTGLGRSGSRRAQRICIARSPDLMTWAKHRENPVLLPDPRWYDVAGETSPNSADWRDPWVFPDPQGDGWHLVLTARASGGNPVSSGVIGHARSADLLTWQAAAPLTATGSGFYHFEVPQIVSIDGRHVLVFSCLSAQLVGGDATRGRVGGVWSVPIDSPTSPFDLDAAGLLIDERYYSGRLVQQHNGQWVLLAFRDRGEDGGFSGTISDPMPVSWSGHGRLEIAVSPVR